jgi:hypothetical protein
MAFGCGLVLFLVVLFRSEPGFENWLNIARYLADAQAMELPLAGGGDHDWNTILLRRGLLQYDTKIAAGLRVGAWLGIADSCVWIAWRALEGSASNGGVGGRGKRDCG